MGGGMDARSNERRIGPEKRPFRDHIGRGSSILGGWAEQQTAERTNIGLDQLSAAATARSCMTAGLSDFLLMFIC
jgi:hypothetical protein